MRLPLRQAIPAESVLFWVLSLYTDT